MKRLQDLMTKQVFSIRADTPIWEAAQVVLEEQIGGLPVVDSENHLKGFLSEKDLLRLLPTADPESKTSDLMKKDVISFKVTDDWHKVHSFLVEKSIRRVPIVDESNVLVGILSRRDIIREMLREKGLFYAKSA